MTHLGSLLTTLRGDQSLYEIEKATGIARTILSKYERGVRIPETPALQKLALHYKVPYKQLRKAHLSDLYTDPLEREIIIEWVKELTI